jgi:inhibitor of cysteine peptidase
MRAAWVFVVLSLSCATAPVEAPPPSQPRMTVSEPGGPVALAVGQELAVQLQANVTTGYAWSVASPVPEVLTVVEPGTYRASAASEGRVGAGGTTSFVFRAVRPGKGVLDLAYRRPWETDVAPARTARFDVEVR